MKNICLLLIAVFVTAVFLNCSPQTEFAYTSGAASPEMLINALLTALKTNNAEQYAELIPNPFMVMEKQKSEARARYEEAVTAGDEDNAAKLKAVADMYEQPTVFENLNAQMNTHVDQALKQMTQLKALLDEKINYDSVKLNEMEVKKNTEQAATCSFFSEKNESVYIVKLSIELYDENWYFTGNASTSLSAKTEKKPSSKTSGEIKQEKLKNLIVLTSTLGKGKYSINGTVTLPDNVGTGNRIMIAYKHTKRLILKEMSSLSDGAKKVSVTTGENTFHYWIKGLPVGEYYIYFGVDMGGNGTFNDSGDLLGYYSGTGKVSMTETNAELVKIGTASAKNINFRVSAIK